MKKAEIVKIMKEANTNKEIKWSVVESKKDRITLTNDYLSDREVMVITAVDDEIPYVKAEDGGHKICYLLIGDDRLCDAKTLEDGMKMAVAETVAYFNYYY